MTVVHQEKKQSNDAVDVEEYEHVRIRRKWKRMTTLARRVLVGGYGSTMPMTKIPLNPGVSAAAGCSDIPNMSGACTSAPSSPS